MGRGRRKSKGKKINPTFFVFCEGETEEAYINMLKSEYRIPSIVINAKIGGNNISNSYIKNYKRTKPTHQKDKTFLLYDLDVVGVLGRLKKIKDSILLVSNPCIELWFLLHYKNQTANTNGDYCYKEIERQNKNYKKGIIDNKLEEKLFSQKFKAVKRAKNLTFYNNPSSTVYRIIETLEELKK